MLGDEPPLFEGYVRHSCGGLDLRFPHHENEMAQTRAAGYDSAARWMHSAWVTAKGEKMSKSLGNGLSVPAVLAENSAWVVRYALGSVQYRSMLEWSDQTLTEAQSAYDRVSNFIERAGAAVGGSHLAKRSFRFLPMLCRLISLPQ